MFDITNSVYKDKIKDLQVKHKDELSKLKEEYRLFLVDKWWNENTNIISFTVELSSDKFRPVKISNVVATLSLYDATGIIFSFPFKETNKKDIIIIDYVNPYA